MNERKTSDLSPVERRIRLSTREIAVSVALTVAALIAIVAFRYGTAGDETAMTRPVASETLRPQ